MLGGDEHNAVAIEGGRQFRYQPVDDQPPQIKIEQARPNVARRRRKVIVKARHVHHLPEDGY